MHQILAYGNEKHEEQTLLANVTTQDSSIGEDGLLAQEFRERVLRQLVTMARARHFDAFQLQYLPPGATAVRTEAWTFQRNADADLGSFALADGRWLHRQYDVTEDLTHIAV